MHPAPQLFRNSHSPVVPPSVKPSAAPQGRPAIPLEAGSTEKARGNRSPKPCPGISGLNQPTVLQNSSDQLQQCFGRLSKLMMDRTMLANLNIARIAASTCSSTCYGACAEPTSLLLWHSRASRLVGRQALAGSACVAVAHAKGSSSTRGCGLQGMCVCVCVCVHA